MSFRHSLSKMVIYEFSFIVRKLGKLSIFHPFPTLAAFLYPGLIGPGIPLNQSGAGGSEKQDVTLAAGFDSDFFNFFPWKLQKYGNSRGKYGIGGFVVPKTSLGPT